MDSVILKSFSNMNDCMILCPPLCYLAQRLQLCGLSKDRPSRAPFCGPGGPERAEVGHIHVPCSLSSPCHADAMGRERLSLSWFTSWVSAFVPEAVPTFPAKDQSGSTKASHTTRLIPHGHCQGLHGYMPGSNCPARLSRSLLCA